MQYLTKVSAVLSETILLKTGNQKESIAFKDSAVFLFQSVPSSKSSTVFLFQDNASLNFYVLFSLLKYTDPISPLKAYGLIYRLESLLFRKDYLPE